LSCDTVVVNERRMENRIANTNDMKLRIPKNTLKLFNLSVKLIILEFILKPLMKTQVT